MIHKKIVNPPRLFPGDTIGIAAPGSPIDIENFNIGIAILEAMNFRIVIPDELFQSNGYLAGTDAHRANLLNGLFADTTVKAIICARGGYGSMRILPMLDFKMIRNNPKIFMGFSDISALLAGIYSRCGFAAIHGPLVTTLGKSTQQTKDAMLSVFSSDVPLEIKFENGTTIIGGVVSGPVFGGNLTVLSHLVGTPYFPNLKGHILFLEDRGEACYRIDRMLIQMKFAGCFKGLSGLMLGSFEECGGMEEIIGIVEDIFKDYSIPVLAGIDVGHGINNVALPIGLNATLNADRKLLSYNEPLSAII